MWCDLSLECSRLLRSGSFLLVLSRSLSIMLYRVDGVDQAKFRVPRQNQKTHALDGLIRPALHVQGCWAHGFGFHFAVADPDLRKDTTTNLEVIARMSESIYRKHGGLAPTLAIIQDNCGRECKNQKILKVVAKFVILKIHRHVWLAFHQKGYTHGPLDSVFGQTAVKLVCSEFDDDEEVVALLQGFLDDGSLELGTDANAVAYKLDEAAPWAEWAEDDLHLAICNLLGPEAPHSFHVCLRQDLSPDELQAEATAWPNAPPPRGGDLVVALRANMSDRKAFQVALLVPHRQVVWLGLHAQDLPKGVHARRPFGMSDRHKVLRAANECYLKRGMSKKAHDYLTQWCIGTRRRHKRPQEYSFLRHRWSEAHAAEGSEQLAPSAARYLDPKWARKSRPIRTEPMSQTVWLNRLNL